MPKIPTTIPTTQNQNDPASDAGRPPSPTGGKPRLLVAEDNPANQRLIVAVLEHAGYTVDVVGDGAEAVAAARRQAYDLILMDIRMPVMGGVEAALSIRALDSPTARRPILALTANAMPGDREAYLAAGMDDYISKPIDLQGLAAKIRTHLEQNSRGG